MAALYMLVLGLGLGLVMQVLVLAVQNAVPYAQLGVATSRRTLFRSIGGSLGTAILGAIFANRLSDELADRLPRGRAAAAAVERGSVNPASSRGLPAPVRDAYVAAFTDSLSTVFLVAAGVVAVGVRARLVPRGAAAAQDGRDRRRRRGVRGARGTTDSLRRDHPRAEPARRPRAHARASSARSRRAPAST